MKKSAPYILVLLVALALLFVRNCGNNSGRRNVRQDTRRETTTTGDRGFNRQVGELVYTHHARCRMDCRHISEEAVNDILQNGSINYRKSEAGGMSCPAYALEGYTRKDQQHLRIVFAQCDNVTKVVTCIDLDHDFECHCPGDAAKHER